MSDDINQEILRELRKLRRVVYATGIILAVVAGYSCYRDSAPSHSSTLSWTAVRAAMARQDFSTALFEAKTLVSRQPDYYYGHACLGDLYLATGDVTNAEAEFLRADQLFPTEAAEKDLAAVRRRLALKSGPASASH